MRPFHLPLSNRVNEPHQRDRETAIRRKEIGHFAEKLKDYQIEISRLPDLSPTELDTRQSAIKVARLIAEKPRLRKFFTESKRLPIHELSKQPAVCKEVIQNYPTYITAMALLFMKDYPHLQDCLRL